MILYIYIYILRYYLNYLYMYLFMYNCIKVIFFGFNYLIGYQIFLTNELINKLFIICI